jgi:hypothetical protein
MASEPPPTIGEAMAESRRVIDRIGDAVAGEPMGLVVVAAASVMVAAAAASGLGDAELFFLVHTLLAARKERDDANG